MSKPCPIIACKSLACHWRGPMPSGRKPRCPKCQRIINPKPGQTH